MIGTSLTCFIEIIDYGYPQNSETEVLKLYITQGKAKKGVLGENVEEDKINKLTVQVTGAGPCPWREPGIKHRKNEIYIDVIESVNLLKSANGLAPLPVYLRDPP